MAGAATLDRAQLLAPTVASLLPSWARSLRASGKSPNTVSGYLDGLRCFTDYLRAFFGPLLVKERVSGRVTSKNREWLVPSAA
jgi:hypothetical protein